MAKIDTLFMTKTPEKTVPFGVAHTYIVHIVKYPGGKILSPVLQLKCFRTCCQTHHLTYVVISVL